jgi:hypothetical protein
MDSNEQQVRTQLAKFFISISNQPRWWYIVKMDSNNQHSLSSLLGLSYGDYVTVFMIAGFIRKKGSRRIETF